MEYDLMVVGNGFDIASGYKTSYGDFVRNQGSCGITNPLVTFFLAAFDKPDFVADEWNGFESLLCQYLQFLDYLFSKENDNVEWRFSEVEYDQNGYFVHRWFYATIKDISKLPNNIVAILCLPNPLQRDLRISSDSSFVVPFCGLDAQPKVKSLYFRTHVNLPEPLSNKKHVLSILLDKLEQELSDLENSLRNYIKIATNGSTQGPSCLRGFKANRVLSFNYSDTAQRIFQLPDEHVAYVHGSVSSDVVIGVEPSMISDQSFTEESAYIKFFKRFRRIYKDCNKNYNRKIVNFLSNDSVIAIYGHSLDMSDQSLLRPLFEKRFKRYDVYCFKDKKYYKLKLAALIGLDLYDELEKDDAIDLITIPK